MIVSVVLGVCWGLVVSAPLARRARRAAVASRLTPGSRPRHGDRSGCLARRITRVVPAPVRRVWSGLSSRRASRRLDDAVTAELPVVVDLLAVAVGAGCTPYLAVDLAARWSPPNLARRLDGVRRACELGSGFEDALVSVATEVPCLAPLTDALLVADRHGAPVGDALVRLSADERAGLRRRAEERARTVPVRLLFPLVFLVLPAFGLLTVVPALLAGFSSP